MRSRIVLVSLVLLAAAGPRPARAGEIVDRIVAIIDREVITLSEAEQARGLVEVRTGQPTSLADVVERLIEDRLVEREAERLVGKPVPIELVDDALSQVRVSFSAEADYRNMLARDGLTEEEVREQLRRQLAITSYLERRFRALSYVTAEEIERYYEEDPELSSPLAPELSAVSDQVRLILEERKFTARVELWIGSLKSRSRIQRYVW
jgi:peptidyl-prolyl cis-trans isomerase SurA